MIFWLMLFVGLLFGFYGARNKFYLLWLMLVDIMISIYLSVMLTPTFVEMIPQGQEEPYHNVISIVVLFSLLFACLYLIANYLFDKNFEVTLPRLFDGVGSGVLGFISGYILMGFLLFVICVTPVAKNKYMRKNVTPLAQKTVAKTCNIVNRWSLHGDNRKVDKVIGGLLGVRGEHEEPGEIRQNHHSESNSVSGVYKDIIIVTQLR